MCSQGTVFVHLQFFMIVYDKGVNTSHRWHQNKYDDHTCRSTDMASIGEFFYACNVDHNNEKKKTERRSSSPHWLGIKTTVRRVPLKRTHFLEQVNLGSICKPSLYNSSRTHGTVIWVFPGLWFKVSWDSDTRVHEEVTRGFMGKWFKRQQLFPNGYIHPSSSVFLATTGRLWPQQGVPSHKRVSGPKGCPWPHQGVWARQGIYS